MGKKTLLGNGYLNWERIERVSDRYGMIFLCMDEDSDAKVLLPQIGGSGRLSALILETRHSAHVGDMFRGIFPGGAVVGKFVVLGDGQLVFEDDYHVGVIPKDGREIDWLDPKALYKCHEQRVSLYFEQLNA